MSMIGLGLAFAVILAALAGLVIYTVIRFLTLCSRLWIRQDFVNGTAVSRTSSEDTGEWDLYRQAQMEQEWLFSQLLLQDQGEAANHDASELPMDW